MYNGRFGLTAETFLLKTNATHGFHGDLFDYNVYFRFTLSK
jgi:hypothetical protein